jgi:hypothetical protein
MLRVCLCCAREYLQLNKPFIERLEHRKCLLCEATVELSKLNAKNSYKKDYMLMKIIKGDDFKCFHDECPFEGAQLDLEKHMTSDCQYRQISCTGRSTWSKCRKFYVYKDEKEHRASCRFFEKCEKCDEHVVKIDMKIHMVTQHGLKECIHCSNLFDTNVVMDHQLVCPEKLMSCTYCGIYHKYNKFKVHLLEHIKTLTDTQEQITQNIKLITTQLEEILD